MRHIRLGRDDCLSCGEGRVQPLLLLMQHGVPHGETGHDMSYDHIVIARCERCGAGQIEIYGHDCFPLDDVWDQFEWYILSADAMRRLAEGHCPTPLLATCDCPLHRVWRAAVMRLPVRPWDTPLEAAAHVHTTPLLWEGDRLR